MSIKPRMNRKTVLLPPSGLRRRDGPQCTQLRRTLVLDNFTGACQHTQLGQECFYFQFVFILQWSQLTYGFGK